MIMLITLITLPFSLLLCSSAPLPLCSPVPLSPFALHSSLFPPRSSPYMRGS